MTGLKLQDSEEYTLVQKRLALTWSPERTSIYDWFEGPREWIEGSLIDETCHLIPRKNPHLCLKFYPQKESPVIFQCIVGNTVVLKRHDVIWSPEVSHHVSVLNIQEYICTEETCSHMIYRMYLQIWQIWRFKAVLLKRLLSLDP